MIDKLVTRGFKPDLDTRPCYRYISRARCWTPCKYNHLPYQPECKPVGFDHRGPAIDHWTEIQAYLTTQLDSVSDEDVSTFIQAFRVGELRAPVLKDYLKKHPHRDYLGITALHREQRAERQRNYVVPETTLRLQAANREQKREWKKAKKDTFLCRRRNGNISQ